MHRQTTTSPRRNRSLHQRCSKGCPRIEMPCVVSTATSTSHSRGIKLTERLARRRAHFQSRLDLRFEYVQVVAHPAGGHAAEFAKYTRSTYETTVSAAQPGPGCRRVASQGCMVQPIPGGGAGRSSRRSISP